MRTGDAMRSGDAIQALGLALQAWVDDMGPRDSREVHRLNVLWDRLARALCGSDARTLQPFNREIGELLRTPRAGSPPLGALAGRLHQLVDAGVRELFVVVAVRDFLDRLIATDLPTHAPRWNAFADRFVPKEIQLGYLDGEVPRVRHVFGPGTET